MSKKWKPEDGYEKPEYQDKPMNPLCPTVKYIPGKSLTKIKFDKEGRQILRPI